MALQISGQVGAQNNADGATNTPIRQGRQGDATVSELHGRFYEQCSRGNMYSAGMSASALSATTVGLTATSTPILGLWNPATSTVNLVISQASITYYANTLSAPVSPGPFVWASSTGNNAISTGTIPFNRKTLTSAGSSTKTFVGGATALTGLTSNLVIFEGADLASPGSLTYGTIVAPTASSNTLVGSVGIQNFDGSLIVPPGGVLALLNVTSSTTFTVAGRILWEEVPV